MSRHIIVKMRHGCASILDLYAQDTTAYHGFPERTTQRHNNNNNSTTENTSNRNCRIHCSTQVQICCSHFSMEKYHGHAQYSAFREVSDGWRWFSWDWIKTRSRFFFPTSLCVLFRFFEMHPSHSFRPSNPNQLLLVSSHF